MCFVVVRPSVAPMTTVSSSWGMGLTRTVGAEVTGRADPRTKYFLACLHCSVGFTAIGALMDCGFPPTPVLCMLQLPMSQG